MFLAHVRHQLLGESVFLYLSQLRRKANLTANIRPQRFIIVEEESAMNGNSTMAPRDAHVHPESGKKEGPYRLFAFAIGCVTDQKSASVLGDHTKYASQILLPLLIIINVFGNVYTQLVMMTMGHQRFKLCYYAAVLAMVDMCLLLLQAVDAWLHASFGIDPINAMVVRSQVMCNTFPFVFNFLTHLRAFLHVTLAVDTFLLSWRPVYYQRVLSSQRVKNAMLVYLVIFLTVNSQFLWTYDIVRTDVSPKGNFCTYSDKWVDTNFTDHAWPAIDLLLGDFLPCLIIAVALVLTIAWIRRHSPVAQTVLEPYIVDLPTFKQIRKIFMCQSALFVVLLLTETIIYLSKLASFRLEKERFNSFAYSIARSKIHSVDFSYFSNPYFVPQMLLQYFDFAFLSLKFVAFLIWCPYFRKLFIEHVQCRTKKIKIGTKLFI